MSCLFFSPLTPEIRPSMLSQIEARGKTSQIPQPNRSNFSSFLEPMRDEIEQNQDKGWIQRCFRDVCGMFDSGWLFVSEMLLKCRLVDGIMA